MRIKFAGELLFSFFIFFLFLGLNSDSHVQVQFKMLAGALGCLFFLVPAFRSGKGLWIQSPTYFFFGCFLIFQAVRFLGGVFSSQWNIWILTGWLFYGFLFWTVPFCFDNKDSVKRLLRVMAWGGFFIAISVIPSFVHEHAAGHGGYRENGVWSFFPPFFYKIHPWINQFVISRFGHANYVGDLAAAGLFPALGLALYAFRIFREKMHEKWEGGVADGDAIRGAFASMTLYFVMAGVIAVMILLFLSRGTMLCFFAALFGYLAFYLIKYFSKRQILYVLLIMGLFGAFFVKFGNFQQSIQELQTIETEKTSTGSLGVNTEGARRAMGIYRTHPFWGAGTNNYPLLAEKFATPGTWNKDFGLVRFETMNYYLQLLAEEGVGAYFYFLFLGAYFLELLIGLVRSKSRFQFLAALSLGAVVFMAFSHGAFNHLLNRFGLPALLFISMAASLAVLRKGFLRQS